MSKTVDSSKDKPYNGNDNSGGLGISEILEPVHSTLRELLAVESNGGYQGKYTDDDVVAVTLLYSLVMGNRLLRQLSEEKVGIVMSHDISNHFTKSIQLITLGMSKVDMSSYYKNQKKN